MRSVLSVNLLLLLLAAFGGWLIYTGIREAIDVEQRKTWPAVAGTILNAQVEDETNRGMVIYVRYQYQIETTTYEGASKISHSPPQPQLPPAFAVGQPIAVLYDPQRPGTSVLDVGDYGTTIFLVIFGTVWLLFLSPFVLYFGLILYAHLMMRKARYHLRKGMEALEEACAETNALADEHGEVPPELARRGAEVIARAKQAKALIRELEEQMPGSAAAESDAETAPMTEGPLPDPLPVLGYTWFWRLVLIVLLVYAAAWGVALRWFGGLTYYLLLAASIAGIALPVASGIWLGQRLVERGRLGTANRLGWCLVVAGGGTFALFAARNKVGYWDTVEGGHIIGPTGTLLGLGILLFGLGMALRHNPKLSADSSD